MGCWSRSDRWRQTWGDGGGHTHSSAPLGAPRSVPPRFYAARALWGESISPHPPLQSETGSHMISVDLWIIILVSFLLISWCLRLCYDKFISHPNTEFHEMFTIFFISYYSWTTKSKPKLYTCIQEYSYMISNILMLQNTFTCTSFSISHDFALP